MYQANCVVHDLGLEVGGCPDTEHDELFDILGNLLKETFNTIRLPH